MNGVYHLSQPARDDLDEIWNHICQDSPQSADRVIDRLIGTFGRLAEMPGIGRPREDLKPGWRSYSVAPYLIFYRLVAGQEREIEVIRVIHGARDYEALLS